jgi:DNA-binding CsgD family transcriptional regulator
MDPKLNINDFTFREYQIILLILRGKSSQEIANYLCISTFTIKKHRENIARKLGSKGKSEFRKPYYR